jgi:pilus assembly protein Flp/PilA
MVIKPEELRSIRHPASLPYSPRLTGGLLMYDFIRHYVKDESGATAIEYGLIAALIAVAIIAAVTSVGTSLNATFTSVAGAL